MSRLPSKLSRAEAARYGLCRNGFVSRRRKYFFNPGSVAFSNENSINIAATTIFANVLYVDSATGEGYRTQNPVGTPFSAYGLFQAHKHDKLKLGLAAYTPFGSTVQWQDAWIGRFALTRLELKAIFYSQHCHIELLI